MSNIKTVANNVPFLQPMYRESSVPTNTLYNSRLTTGWMQIYTSGGSISEVLQPPQSWNLQHLSQEGKTDLIKLNLLTPDFLVHHKKCGNVQFLNISGIREADENC